jgi:hypothetical protein
MDSQRKNHKKEKRRKGRTCIFLRANKIADAKAKRLMIITMILISGWPKK